MNVVTVNISKLAIIMIKINVIFKNLNQKIVIKIETDISV